MKLELDAPNVGVLEKRYVSRTIDKGFVATFGPYVGEFQKKFAKYLGVNRAVSTQSGTAALHMALYELGIKNGDEVIVPALTFVASVNPILYIGAKPVFVDVDLKTWTIDPKEIEAAITERTKAIIAVHLYGSPCRIDEIVYLAKKYKISLVEDATESLGATYRRKHTGTWGDFGCFSFNGNKIITTGGGGIVIARNAKRIEHIEFLVNQAKHRSKGYFHPEIGFNYRMTNLEAAVGLAQLERMNDLLIKKVLLHSIYKEELSGSSQLSFQEKFNEAKSSWWFNCIFFKKDMDLVYLQSRLAKKGIPTRRVFMPIVEFPPYKKYRKKRLDNSYLIYKRALCLPSSTLNSQEGVRYVCKNLKELF